MTDTIPRVNQLVAHARAIVQLPQSGDATFEAARRKYAETAAALAATGDGRITASRVPERDRFWAPTRDLLQELMRWEWVAGARLPGERGTIDAYRDSRYHLTPEGMAAAAIAEGPRPPFVDLVTAAALSSHPYLDGLLRLLEEAPLVCPELSEGHINEQRLVAYWIPKAAEMLGVVPELVEREVMSQLHRRFGRVMKKGGQPRPKETAEAVNDALAATALAARDLPIGAASLGVLKEWGSQLLLFDQSRYVPGFEHANVLWIACTLTDEPDNPARRRGLSTEGVRVAEALTLAAQELSDRPGDYVDIFRARAAAAHSTQTTRQLGNLVLARLAAGEYPDIGQRIFLHRGTSGRQWPRSEPIFRTAGGALRRLLTIESPNGGRDRDETRD